MYYAHQVVSVYLQVAGEILLSNKNNETTIVHDVLCASRKAWLRDLDDLEGYGLRSVSLLCGHRISDRSELRDKNVCSNQARCRRNWSWLYSCGGVSNFRSTECDRTRFILTCANVGSHVCSLGTQSAVSYWRVRPSKAVSKLI